MTGTDRTRYKALAHPTRLFIVEQLSKHERCVHELTAMIGVEMPTVSRHLSILKGAGILEDEKRGAHVVYRLRTPCVMSFFRCDTEVRRVAIRRETALLECDFF